MQLQMIRQAFARYDLAGTGRVTAPEVRQALQQMGAEALRARLKEAESQVASRVEEAVAAAKEEWEQTHSEMARQSMTLATQAAVQKNELDSLCVPGRVLALALEHHVAPAVCCCADAVWFGTGRRSKLRQAEGVTGRLRADLQRTTASLKDTQNSRNAARVRGTA